MEAPLTEITIQEVQIGSRHAFYSGYYNIESDDDSFHVVRFWEDEDFDLCKTTCAVYSKNIFGYELIVTSEIPGSVKDE